MCADPTDDERAVRVDGFGDQSVAVASDVKDDAVVREQRGGGKVDLEFGRAPPVRETNPGFPCLERFRRARMPFGIGGENHFSGEFHAPHALPISVSLKPQF